MRAAQILGIAGLELLSDFFNLALGWCDANRFDVAESLARDVDDADDVTGQLSVVAAATGGARARSPLCPKKGSCRK